MSNKIKEMVRLISWFKARYQSTDLGDKGVRRSLSARATALLKSAGHYKKVKPKRRKRR